jgi:hypothetical protein
MLLSRDRHRAFTQLGRQCVCLYIRFVVERPTALATRLSVGHEPGPPRERAQFEDDGALWTDAETGEPGALPSDRPTVIRAFQGRVKTAYRVRVSRPANCYRRRYRRAINGVTQASVPGEGAGPRATAEYLAPAILVSH